MPGPAELIAIGAAGVAAGSVNAVAGGGSLLTFPLLVATGVPALTANLSNTIGQLPGYVSIVGGYRAELSGQRARMVRLGAVALIGGVAGIVALKLGGQGTFRVVAPIFVLLASALLAVQPLVARRVAAGGGAPARDGHGAVLLIAIASAGAYFAYFGAAGGVILLALLALRIDDTLQRLNALNRFLVLVVNVMAAVVFAILGPVDWTVVAVLAPTTFAGGHVGVGLTRRLDDRILRAVIVAIGLVAGVVLILTG